MKKLLEILFITVAIFRVTGQTNFSPDDYKLFLKQNQNLDPLVFLSESEPTIPYCNQIIDAPDLSDFYYLDSVILKLGLTEGELTLLKKNHFMVSERLNYNNFGKAFHTVYNHDLPVFITTDAILHALHKSYNEILMFLEKYVMLPALESGVKKLYNNYNTVYDKYKNDTVALVSLEDVDLYITVAYSLLKDTLQSPHLINESMTRKIWDLIKAEQATKIDLFADRLRDIDFSQYKPRGHYVYDGNGINLEPYFRCMMWLGRTELFLTPPPENPWEEPWKMEEIQRMIFDALVINELAISSKALEEIELNDKIITYLVGEPDNVTPAQMSSIIDEFGLSSPLDIFTDTVYNDYQVYLKKSDEYQQKILSEIIMVNPFNASPDTISVVYKLMGQRFILDSYILGNVIYDKIIYNDKKIQRLMPDPLDAMYVLGNDNGALLMTEEIEKYKYSTNLKALRYLVDSYDNEFWNMSLYNIWLSAIRDLNTINDTSGIPFFMKTNAWQHEKLNTQLGSWSQLRHDNLLYAKQSYTPGIGCSYPYSYVEPYPEFFNTISEFAKNAGNFFKNTTDLSNSGSIISYFERLDTICNKLKTLAEKELSGKEFSDEEKEFLENMLYLNWYPSPFYTGWYMLLFFTPDDVANQDYIIADIHTQPTDSFGGMVGRVLHAATGKINLGVFLCPIPGSNKYTAFVGPVMSYYQTISEGFHRYTDQEWEEMVLNNRVPERPNWVNIYLADSLGNTREKGIELPGISFKYMGLMKIDPIKENEEKNPVRLEVFPNPVIDKLNIVVSGMQNKDFKLSLYDIHGKKVGIIFANELHSNGLYCFDFSHLRKGVYFLNLESSDGRQVVKIVR